MQIRFRIIRSLVNDFLNSFNFYALELKCVILIPLAFLIKIFLSHTYKQSNIWVIGEGFGDCSKDNGYCFFKFCHNAAIDPEVFFVAKKSIIDNDPFLSSNSNTLSYGSIRHITYLFLADVFIYTHTHRDIIYHKLFPLFKQSKKLIFMKHGVTGFKKFHSLYQECRNEPDILIVVSDFEKSIISKHVGTEEDRIRITGFARYDNLEDTSSCKIQKQIAYLPTWRDWIKKRAFFDSTFYKCISSLTRDRDLANLLEERGVTLKCYLHKNMKSYSSFFDSKSPHIQLIEFGQESVQEMIKESSLLITDYSSVSWDFFYLDKPVIFFQFDYEDYLHYRGSYLDLKKEIFGDHIESKYHLIDTIDRYIDSDFKLEERFKVGKSTFFKYSDKSNCIRIYEEIMRT